MGTQLNILFNLTTKTKLRKKQSGMRKFLKALTAVDLLAHEDGTPTMCGRAKGFLGSPVAGLLVANPFP